MNVDIKSDPMADMHSIFSRLNVNSKSTAIESHVQFPLTFLSVGGKSDYKLLYSSNNVYLKFLSINPQTNFKINVSA